jgi:hypothetical protein
VLGSTTRGVTPSKRISPKTLKGGTDRDEQRANNHVGRRDSWGLALKCNYDGARVNTL